MAKTHISLELNAETLEKIAQAASRAGQDTRSFLENHLTETFGENSFPRRGLDEVLAPFRAEIESSGLTDAQLDTLFTQSRDAAYAARHQNPR